MLLSVGCELMTKQGRVFAKNCGMFVELSFFKGTLGIATGCRS